ncbi:MAG: thiamine pyrophosphate-dependent dehydrogenase E1 component subunit alpha, partial [Chloroflexota bacterium]|nr:thiamine pyrophosphate-dependent dehydrogenase E1 component subunit alpha [Chloroflexota bacterium]
IPHAVGIALASKLRGEKDVTIVYFGDGATSEGDFHEGLNFAAVRRLPVIFFCENNGYAISVPLSKQMAVANVADRAEAYGFPGITVDGNDVVAVYQATKAAVERARRGGGPSLIEARTYRLVPHSSDDDDRRYRSREEVEEWRGKDPLPRLKAYLQLLGALSHEQDDEIHRRVAREVDDATDFAEQSPYPQPEDALTNVYGAEEG